MGSRLFSLSCIEIWKFNETQLSTPWALLSKRVSWNKTSIVWNTGKAGFHYRQIHLWASYTYWGGDELTKTKWKLHVWLFYFLLRTKFFITEIHDIHEKKLWHDICTSKRQARRKHYILHLLHFSHVLLQQNDNVNGWFGTANILSCFPIYFDVTFFLLGTQFI